MFPTISYFINSIFGTDYYWPIPTFGVFVVLAFLLSYLTFRAEFSRRQVIGEIKPIHIVKSFTALYLIKMIIGFALLGFLIGYKGGYIFNHTQEFLINPKALIFSSKGSWVAGLCGCILLVVFAWLSLYKVKSTGNTKELIILNVAQLTPKMLLYCAFYGFIGAKLFNLIENYDLYLSHHIIDILRFSGLTFYGGLVFGAITYLYIGRHYGIPWLTLTDVGSMGMLVAYGVGRLGCHFSGDGDWGIVNNNIKPLAWIPDKLWANTFPHNVINHGVPIPQCTGKYCMVLPEGVFPTSIYESIIILTIFLVLWLCRKKIKIPGLIFTIYLYVISLERFLIELIRVNYKYEIMGITISEAQLISVLLFLLAIGMSCYLIASVTKFKKSMN